MINMMIHTAAEPDVLAPKVVRHAVFVIHLLTLIRNPMLTGGILFRVGKFTVYAASNPFARAWYLSFQGQDVHRPGNQNPISSLVFPLHSIHSRVIIPLETPSPLRILGLDRACESWHGQRRRTGSKSYGRPCSRSAGDLQRRFVVITHDIRQRVIFPADHM
jgi:hypothetical protein